MNTVIAQRLRLDDKARQGYRLEAMATSPIAIVSAASEFSRSVFEFMPVVWQTCRSMGIN
jgi:hypothetical protein